MSLAKRVVGMFLKDFPDGVISIDAKTRKILELNPVAANLLGYEQNELIGKDVLILHPAAYQKKKRNLIISNPTHKNASFLTDIPFVRKNGEIFFVDIASVKFNYNSSIVLIEFLRDRRKIIPVSCDWNFLYEQLAVMTEFGSFIVVNKKFAYVNEAFIELLGGKSPSQFIEKEAIEIIPKQDRERLTCIYEGLISGTIPIATFQQRIIKLDGEEIPCLIRSTRAKYCGEVAVHSIIQAAHQRTALLDEKHKGDKEELPKALTQKEIDVLCLLAKGNTIKEIAAVLGIAYPTVMTHKHSIMKKLHFKTVADIARYAVKNRLVEVD